MSSAFHQTVSSRNWPLTLKVGINGFGRIGRVFYRAALKRQAKIDIVAVNDVVDSRTLGHLLKFDSIHGKLNADLKCSEDSFTVNGKETKVFSARDPSGIPWRQVGVDVVLESTGLFTKREDASKHLSSGASKVIITAPSKNPDVTIIPGVNDEEYDSKKHSVISMGSCTTNCVVPVAKVLEDNFGIVRGFMLTVHAYTNDQRVLDLPHRDLRRARAAGLSIIPTTTGAAAAVGMVMPRLKGKLDGVALRVPVSNGSVLDMTTELARDVSVDSVNEAFRKAAEGELKPIMEYSTDPLVSVDIIGNPHSAIFDSLSTMVVEKKMAKVLAWYDNEWGYSCRLLDLLETIAKK
jgi:glyceraldehyde 3-phosphate dehydrogenase